MTQYLQNNLGRAAIAQEAQDFANGHDNGVKLACDELKQLCADLSDRNNRPYMGDVLASIDAVRDRCLSPQGLKNPPMPLSAICAYQLPGGAKLEQCSQLSGPSLWAVRENGNCLNKGGDWECEPYPSGRDEGFLHRCRWATPQDAYDAWVMATQQQESPEYISRAPAETR